MDMAVAIYFNPATLNEKQYRAVTDQLASEGDWPPAGLVHHSCFGEGDKLMVYEVWESQSALDAFGPRLMPVLQKHDVNPGEPMVMPVVNVVP
jgi:quinol monooxygenase YgiN